MKRRYLLVALLPLAVGAVAAQTPGQSRAQTHTPSSKVSVKSTGGMRVQSDALASTAQAFLKSQCMACHNGALKQGGLDLSTLKFELSDTKAFATWTKVHDRVEANEMPPKGANRPSEASRKAFLQAIVVPMVHTDVERARREGRAVWRRMNRYEYENSLRDLLDAPWLQIRDMLPEDGMSARFNKVGEALDVSHVQMTRYMAAADYALREAMAKQTTPVVKTVKRYYARDQRSFSNLSKFTVFNGSPERATFPMIGDIADLPALQPNGPMTVGASDPAKRETEGMGVVASSYEPIQPKFDQFRVPVSGRYKLRLCGHSFWAAPESAQRWWRPSRTQLSAGRTLEPVSLYASSPPQILRKVGSLDIGPTKTVSELDVILLKGETIQPDAVRLFRSRPPNWHNPLAQKDGQPGVVFQWLEVEGPIFDTWPGQGHRLMFGDLPLKREPTQDGKGKVTVASSDPDGDTERLMQGFIRRAYRRPVTGEDVRPFVSLARKAREAGADFTESMITGYTAVLCSPGFVTLEEKPGTLDDYALATRLSYLLWNSEPDTDLRALASRGALHRPEVLRSQADRLLADPRSQRFVDAFLDYWLDLRKTSSTSPDADIYPDYYLDDFLVESSIDETRTFFAELVRRNLPARNLVASNFVMVNGRLAELYGIPDVQGAALRRVDLPSDSIRGGLLTQASVLKVTANGTTTSPVLRGVWINERVLGLPVPPPPPSVPAVEPDTRGATTIREQLDKHRTQPSCRACHARIDPAGFALENFDVFGGWRERYRGLGEGQKVAGFGKNGQPFAFHAAAKVDASGTLPDGRQFKDVRDLKSLILKDERQVARNLVRQLVVYGTGAPVRFGDRPEVEAILDRARPTSYGVKSLIQAMIESELFRNK